MGLQAGYELAYPSIAGHHNVFTPADGEVVTSFLYRRLRAEIDITSRTSA